jgi:hypothetical protein
MGMHSLIRSARHLVLLGLGSVALSASAAFLDSPVPASAYITKGAWTGLGLLRCRLLVVASI